MENLYRQEQAILNGRFKLITEDSEYKMSLWVREFGITDNSGNIILEIASSFSLDKFEEKGDQLKVYFKIFPNGSKQYVADIDPINKIVLYENKTIDLNHFAKTFKEML